MSARVANCNIDLPEVVVDPQEYEVNCARRVLE